MNLQVVILLAGLRIPMVGSHVSVLPELGFQHRPVTHVDKELMGSYRMVAQTKELGSVEVLVSTSSTAVRSVLIKTLDAKPRLRQQGGVMETCQRLNGWQRRCRPLPGVEFSIAVCGTRYVMISSVDEMAKSEGLCRLLAEAPVVSPPGQHRDRR